MRLLKSIYRELDLTLALLHTVFSILLSLSHPHLTGQAPGTHSLPTPYIIL